MSDPLSTGASVVGLIGFGLKTCNAVMTYLDAVKSRSQEIEGAKKEVQTIRHLLATIENSTDKISSSHESSKSAVRACMATCHIEIAALEALNFTLQGSTAVGQDSRVWHNIRDQGKKLTYPFHRSKLDRLQAQLGKVTGTLQVALQVAGIDVVVGVENTVMIMHTSTLPSIQEQLDSIQPRLMADTVQLTDQLLENNRLIREDVSPLLKSLACDNKKNMELGAEILALHRHTNSAGVSQVLEDPSCAGQHILSYRQAVGRLLAKPSQLKELCEITNIRNMEPDLSTRSGTRVVKKQLASLEMIKPSCLNCSCRMRRFTHQHIAGRASWVFISELSKTHRHLAGCPFYNPDTIVREMRWELRYSGLRRLIDCALGLSFSSSFGAGGFSVSPGLTYYPSVDSSKSPVFRILDLMYWFLWSITGNPEEATEDSARKWMEFTELCVANIIQLYREGKASPKSIDGRGRSAMHHLVQILACYRCEMTRKPFLSLIKFVQKAIYCRKPSTMELIHDRVHDLLLTLLGGLVSSGVPLMTQDVYGATPAWELCVTTTKKSLPRSIPGCQEHPINPGVIDLICSHDPYAPILARSSLVGHNSLFGKHLRPERLLSLLKNSPATAEDKYKACECGPLSLAVLTRNEPQIVDLLTNHPSTLHERNLFGQTPLHLAVGQPALLTLLMQGCGKALNDETDSVGHTAMEYAAYDCHIGATEHCTVSLSTILEADCKVPNQTSDLLSYQCQSCKEELFRHIKDRRERLKTYALERLPGADASAMGLREAAVLDSKAGLVAKALRSRGFEIPSPLQLDALNKAHYRPNSVTVFHRCFGHNRADFDILFDLGFRDIDAFDPVGLSPLISLCSEMPKLEVYEVCIWFIEHGVNLWDPVPNTNLATTAHHLYGFISMMNHDLRDADPEQVKSSVQALTTVLSTHDIRDGCRCRCSPGGCSTIAWFLRCNLGVKNILEEYPDNMQRISMWFAGFLIEKKPTITMDQLRLAIRCLTFDFLEIRHTCIHGGPFQTEALSEEEIGELTVEDAPLVNLLEELVVEFESELQSLCTEEDPYGLPLWETYWPERMKAVKEELNGSWLSREDLLSAQQIGVKWHDSDDDDDSPGQHEPERESDYSYHESDWNVLVKGEMFGCTFHSLNDWKSMLDSIMSGV